ncbi:MAG TPA: hypothetical protein VEX88_05285 [Glaciibacter sp.]|nr:hypothetical protein [Glaciibacter sp.]
MGLLDLVLGRKLDMEPEPVAAGASREDARAVDRYEQMLRTAPSDVIEKVHVEAFEKLTPAQLDLLLERFSADAPSPEERPADAQPATLARAAAQAETRQPGALARIFKGDHSGISPATWVGYSILDTVAWYAIASVAFGSWTPSGTEGAAATGTGSDNVDQDATSTATDMSASGGFWDFLF